MPSNRLDIRPVSGAVGAEIHGVDLAEPMIDETLSTIRNTLADRGVVFFRDQWLTPEQHIVFARRFGNININRFFAHADGYPEIALVVKEPHQTKNIGGGWHTDHSYDLSLRWGSGPACTSLLVRVATPCSPACMPRTTPCRTD